MKIKFNEPRNTRYNSTNKINYGLDFVNKPNLCTIFSYMLISILYIFRAAMFPSSEELIVSVRHLVYVNLCR